MEEQEHPVILEDPAPDAYDEEFIDLLLFGGKVCSACAVKRPKHRTYFTTDPRQEDGLKAACRTCVAARARLRYQNDPVAKAKLRARQRECARRRKAAQVAS